MSATNLTTIHEEKVVTTVETLNTITAVNAIRTYDNVLKDYYDTQKNRSVCSVCNIL